MTPVGLGLRIGDPANHIAFPVTNEATIEADWRQLTSGLGPRNSFRMNVG